MLLKLCSLSILIIFNIPKLSSMDFQIQSKKRRLYSNVAYLFIIPQIKVKMESNVCFGGVEVRSTFCHAESNYDKKCMFLFIIYYNALLINDSYIKSCFILNILVIVIFKILQNIMYKILCNT